MPPSLSEPIRGAARAVRRTAERHPHAAALAAFAAVTAIAPALAAASSPPRPGTLVWYRRLDKPPFTPPPAAFGPVWTVLYGLIALSGSRVYGRPRSRARTRALRWWAAQLAFNAAWTPLFFGQRRLRVSLADSVALLASAAGYTMAAWRVDRPAGAMTVPYVAWSALATAINFEVARRNP